MFFRQGFGSILYDKKINFLSIDEEFDFSSSTEDAEIKIDIPNNAKLATIRHCVFYKLKDSSNLIAITDQISFYMTSCTFIQCTCTKTVIDVKAKLATFSHICVSDLRPKGSFDYDGVLFLKSNTVDSYLKFIYSSFYGGSTNYDRCACLCDFQGKSSIRYQCINTSFFKISKEGSSILKFTAPSCLNMIMSTFYKLESSCNIFINVQESADDVYNQYVEMTNFVNNNFYDFLFLIDFKDNKKMYFNLCIFRNENGNSKYFKIRNPSSRSKVFFVNCEFDKNINDDSQDYGIWIENDNQRNYVVEYQDCITKANPETKVLAHYIVEDYCEGVNNSNAYGCQNNTCPDGFGCPPEAFKPKPGDYTFKE